MVHSARRPQTARGPVGRVLASDRGAAGGLSAPRGHRARLRSVGGADAGARQRAGRDRLSEKRPRRGSAGQESGEAERRNVEDVSFELEGMKDKRRGNIEIVPYSFIPSNTVLLPNVITYRPLSPFFTPPPQTLPFRIPPLSARSVTFTLVPHSYVGDRAEL